MNFYFYWYYFVYSIYRRYSLDDSFALYTGGMFSFFIMSLIFSLSEIVSVIFDTKNICAINVIVTIGVFLCILVVNWIVFLPEKRNELLFERFKRNQTNFKDIMAIIISLLSVVALFLAIFSGRTRNI